MKTKKLSEDTVLLAIETGEEVMKALQQFAKTRNIRAGHFKALGAFERSVIAFWNPKTKEYEKIPVDEQVEVLSMIGNLAVASGEPKVHAHVVLGRRDGSTIGGHLFEGYVRPTLEVVITSSPATLERRVDPETKLPLLALD